MIRVKLIDRDDPLFSQAADLRERVLLAPIGYDLQKFDNEYPAFTTDAEHVVAVLDHPTGEKVIGTASLLTATTTKGEGKLTQMAVDPQRRREGIGRQLVVELEKRAINTHNLDRLVCHAQTHAVPFYEALGWFTEGDEFTEAGIPHYRMVYDRSRAEVAPATPNDDDASDWGDDAVLGV